MVRASSLTMQSASTLRRQIIWASCMYVSRHSMCALLVCAIIVYIQMCGCIGGCGWVGVGVWACVYVRTYVLYLYVFLCVCMCVYCAVCSCYKCVMAQYTHSDGMYESQTDSVLDVCDKTIQKYGVGSCGPRGFYG